LFHSLVFGDEEVRVEIAVREKGPVADRLAVGSLAGHCRLCSVMGLVWSWEFCGGRCWHSPLHSHHIPFLEHDLDSELFGLSKNMENHYITPLAFSCGRAFWEGFSVLT